MNTTEMNLELQTQKVSRQRFKALMEGAEDGLLQLVSCWSGLKGAQVDVICLKQKVDGGVNLYPLAEIVEDPRMYMPPEGVAEGTFKSTGHKLDG